MRNIPVLYVTEQSLAAAYEKALVELYRHGIEFKTQYDKPGDPPSLDATMNITVLDPESEPMIHKAFPGGVADLREYVMELMGVKDHWVKNMNDPDDTHWEYTYHGRLQAYGAWRELRDGVSTVAGPFCIDQIDGVIAKLAQQPFTRQAQMITWMPNLDLDCYDPPCFVAGTKIRTPNGEVNIEEIKDNDTVYAFDMENKILIPARVKSPFIKQSNVVKLDFGIGSVIVSNEQLMLVNGEWQKAQDITLDKFLTIPTVCGAANITDEMVAGYMHGDGWLSSGWHQRKKWASIKRRDINFSIHKRADKTWIYEYISSYTDNTIKIENRFISSNTVPKGGTSIKVRVHSKDLYDKLAALGCPIGTKQKQEITWDISEKNDIQCAEFLTGIFSAEGCIYLPKDDQPSIQLGMNWKEAVDLAGFLLERLGIAYTSFQTGSTYHIRIDTTENILKAVSLFDFRLDSRKQAKYLKLKHSIYLSNKLLEERVFWVKKANEMKQQGLTHREIMKVIPCWNPRMLYNNYAPTFRWVHSNGLIHDSYVEFPVSNIEFMPEATVFDFEIDHKDHAIVANGVVAHNCLQSIWYRILEEDGIYYLNCNIRFRSNDAWGANFMNMFGFTQFNREVIAAGVARRTGKTVRLGRLNWQADSYHIYGKDLARARQQLFDRLATTRFEDRVLTLRDELIQEIYQEAEAEVIQKIKRHDAG